MNDGARPNRTFRFPPVSALLLLLGAAAAAVPSTSGCKSEPQVAPCNVYALFERSCDGAACHGAEAPRANLDLVSPGVDQRLFHELGTADCDQRKLVFPGRPEDSLLYVKVSESDPFCGARMPVGKALPAEDIACIKSYIDDAGKDTEVQDCETCGGILCVDMSRDPNHCGACYQPCGEGEICGGGSCIAACSEGQTQCGSSCVDIGSSNQHCGACDHRCGPGSSCQQGVCTCDPSSQGAGGAGGVSGDEVGEVPSFQNDVLPIFENSCAGSDCHTETDRAAPLGLEPMGAYANLVGVTADECGTKDYVIPNSPDQSYLVEKLMGGDICSGERMPLGDDPLPTAAIHTIVNWICAGAPNN